MSSRNAEADEMSGKGNGAGFSARAAAAENRAQGLDIGWTVFGYLIAGMLAYGGIGWLIGRAVHVPLLFPIGMLVGLGISIGFIIYRYGKQGAVTWPSPQQRASSGASAKGDDR
jgi:ATP synthase protein I